MSCSTLHIPNLIRILIHDTVRFYFCTGLKWIVPYFVQNIGSLYKNDIVQYRLSTTAIQRYHFCIELLLYTEELCQYGTVQYRLCGMRYRNNGKGVVSECCAKRYRLVFLWYRVQTMRYRGDINYHVDNSAEMCTVLYMYVFTWKCVICHQFVPVSTNND